MVVNVQGDEPFIRPEQINDIVGIFTKYPDTRLATLARPYPQDRSYEGLEDPNMVKLVMGDDGRALYFSRSVIPYLRGVDKKDWPARHQYYSHIGIYAYTPSALAEIVKIPRGSLEIAESLEQLRWLQNGYEVRVAVSDFPTIGIDTPEDLAAAEAFLKQA